MTEHSLQLQSQLVSISLARLTFFPWLRDCSLAICVQRNWPAMSDKTKSVGSFRTKLGKLFRVQSTSEISSSNKPSVLSANSSDSFKASSSSASTLSYDTLGSSSAKTINTAGTTQATSTNGSVPPAQEQSLILSGIKTALTVADSGLKGIGLPGVEGLPSLLLTIISYYEVRQVLFSYST